MDSEFEDLQLEQDFSSPWKRVVFEVSMVVALVILFILIGISAYRAVEEELNIQKQLGGDLLVECQRSYWDEVYNPEMSTINPASLDEFYNRHRDCKIFNVTDLDPLFYETVNQRS